ncbi:MAG: nuclear transport factor 2 family protein [Marinirhabdus sp.]|nr:nuclear transport factor 2 family protein [Marinirhabdus sp.]
MKRATVLVLIICGSLSAQSVSDEILTQNRAMEVAYRAGDLMKVASFYTKDAAIVGPRKEVVGEAEVTKYWQGLEGRHVDWELENISITPYDDVVIQRGVSHLTFKYKGDEVTSVARFTLVWIQEDGQWKISNDHYSPL